MRLEHKIEVSGQQIRASSWEVGHQAGSAHADWRISPLEAAEQYDPPDAAADVPVNIKLTAQGTEYVLLANGRLQAVSDRAVPGGIQTTIQGVDGSWRLYERGPLRDTVFVPRTIIRELYPRGILITTLNGDQVLGIPPRARKIHGEGPRPNSDGAMSVSSKANHAVTSRTMMDETEWTAIIDPPICDPLEAFGDAYAKANLPDFVIVGGDRGLKVKSYLEDENQPDDACDNAKIASKRVAGGVNALTINHLIKLIATKAGFSGVKINTPDLPLFEPITVNAGATWYATIMSLVAPWNPLVFVIDNVLHILDIEAADLSINQSIRLSGDSLIVLGRQVSRIPPYRGVNVTGPLRAGLAAMREFRRGNPDALSALGFSDDDCRPPIKGGMGCAKDDLPANFRIAPPPRAERISTHSQEGLGEVQEVLISGEQPYNLEVTRTYGSPGAGPFWDGEEGVNWSAVTARKLYFADPALGQIQLRFLERKVTGSNSFFGIGAAPRTLSRQITRIIQGRFGNTPCQVVQEEYAQVRLPGLPFGGEQLIRRTITNYSENLSVEGTWDSTTDVYVLTVFTIGPNLGLYKPIPYDEAAHSGTIDLSGNSMDAFKLAHYCRTTESYQVLDRYFAQKETATVYSYGGEPPSAEVEVFMYNQPEVGSLPGARQRYCFGVNIDGSLVKSVYAVGCATEEQALLVAGRAARRGGQRQVRMEVEVPTFLPGVRPGIGVTIEGTPVKVLNRANTEMTTVNRLAGNFFVCGYRYVGFFKEGSFRVHTRLSLRSQF